MTLGTINNAFISEPGKTYWYVFIDPNKGPMKKSFTEDKAQKLPKEQFFESEEEITEEIMEKEYKSYLSIMDSLKNTSRTLFSRFKEITDKIEKKIDFIKQDVENKHTTFTNEDKERIKQSNQES